MLIAAGLCAGPTHAFQVQQVTPIAPSLSLAGPAASVGSGDWLNATARFGASALGSGTEITSIAPNARAGSANAPGFVGFTIGQTEQRGRFLFSHTRGGFGSLSVGALGFSRAFGSGPRINTGYMLSDTVLLYTSVSAAGGGQDPYAALGAPQALAHRGLGLTPSTGRDVRAGVQLQVAPGLTFMLEGAVQR